MAISDTDILYSARNVLRAELNKSQTGFFLRDYLISRSKNGAKIANNKKLLAKFLNLVEQNSGIMVTILVAKNGTDEEKLWVHNPIRHAGHPFPSGYEPKTAVKDKPNDVALELEASFVPDLDGETQAGKYDPRPEPNTVVHSTKAPQVPNAFASLATELAKPRAEKPVTVEQPKPLPKEKDPEMTLPTPVSATSLMETAKEMMAAAERLERSEKNEALLTEVRLVQAQVDKATTTLQRLFDEQVEAFIHLNNANIRLRELLASE